MREKRIHPKGKTTEHRVPVSSPREVSHPVPFSATLPDKPREKKDDVRGRTTVSLVEGENPKAIREAGSERVPRARFLFFPTGWGVSVSCISKEDDDGDVETSSFHVSRRPKANSVFFRP